MSGRTTSAVARTTDSDGGQRIKVHVSATSTTGACSELSLSFDVGHHRAALTHLGLIVDHLAHLVESASE